MNQHWATEYIGKPWQYAATGPDAYDCWGFVCAVQRDRFGIQMMDVEYDENWRTAANHLKQHDERRHWDQVEVKDAHEGDVVLMARARLPIHIGIWIAANATEGVLHCLQGIGVTFTPSGSLRGQGWGSLQYFRRKAV